MLSYILWYLLCGMVVIIATAFGHIIRAERRGYKVLDYLTKTEEITKSQKVWWVGWLNLLWTVPLWPVRLVFMLTSTKSGFPSYYKNYERRD